VAFGVCHEPGVLGSCEDEFKPNTLIRTNDLPDCRMEGFTAKLERVVVTYSKSLIGHGRLQGDPERMLTSSF
jgi:hypothetical protein